MTQSQPTVSPFHRSATAPGPCPKCGYDLRATRETTANRWTCPECGGVFSLREFIRYKSNTVEKVATFAGLVGANLGLLLLVSPTGSVPWLVGAVLVACLLEAIALARPIGSGQEARKAWIRTGVLAAALAVATGLIVLLGLAALLKFGAFGF